jgi:hypothetical protein
LREFASSEGGRGADVCPGVKTEIGCKLAISYLARNSNGFGKKEESRVEEWELGLGGIGGKEEQKDGGRHKAPGKKVEGKGCGKHVSKIPCCSVLRPAICLSVCQKNWPALYLILHFI